jgi:hypothetical protein
MLKNSTLVGVLAAIVSVVLVGRLIYKQLDHNPKVNVEPFAMLGSMVADETSKLLPSGGKVVVLSVDTAKYNVATLDTLLSAFRKALRGNIKILNVEKFRIPATSFMALSRGALVPPAGEFAPGQFQKIAQNYSSADAIVSFVGLPPSLSSSSSELQQKRSKIIVVSERDPELLNLLRSHMIDLAIVPRAEPSNDKGSKTSAYEILTSDK